MALSDAVLLPPTIVSSTQPHSPPIISYPLQVHPLPRVSQVPHAIPQHWQSCYTVVGPDCWSAPLVCLTRRSRLSVIPTII